MLTQCYIVKNRIRASILFTERNLWRPIMIAFSLPPWCKCETVIGGASVCRGHCGIVVWMLVCTNKRFLPTPTTVWQPFFMNRVLSRYFIFMLQCVFFLIRSIEYGGTCPREPVSAYMTKCLARLPVHQSILLKHCRWLIFTTGTVRSCWFMGAAYWL